MIWYMQNYVNFGLSVTKNNYRPSTPGTVTSWYRAPEICCRHDYSYDVDIWSTGLIFFEIITNRPLIKTKKDKDQDIFRKIITKIPEKLKNSEINSFIKKGRCKSFRHGYDEDLTPEKKPFEDHLNELISVRQFNDKNKDHSLQFCDLLNNMIRFNPEKRFTAKECINHVFFDFIKSYISEMRIKYPPKINKDQKVKIIKCIERDWFCNIIIDVYNNHEKYEWYSNDILFHAIRLFDVYMVYCYQHNEKNKIITKEVGHIHTYNEIELIAYSCIYIMYKYFLTLNPLYEWDSFYPKHIYECNIEQNITKIETFENLLIRKVCSYKIFSFSLLDYLSDDFKIKNKKINTYEIRNLLYNYCHLNTNYEGNMKDLYEQFDKSIHKNNTK